MVIEEWTIIFWGGGWAIFLGTFFFGDSNNNTNDKPAYSCQAFLRTFVHLDKPLQKVPAKKTVQKITKAGWVKDLAFTKNNTAKDIQRILLANFATLMGLNLSK